MSTHIDIRQVETRTLQDQLSGTAVTQMDSILASINSELTSPGRLIASSTSSLVVNVGAGEIVNPSTSKNRILPLLNNSLVSFPGGTITFPSTSGTITVSPGTNATITIGANQFVAVLVQLTASGQLNLVVGAAAGSLGAVVFPTGSSAALSLGYIVAQSNGSSVIQNITNSMLYQFSGAGGSGSGSGGGVGDDIDSLNYSASFTDLFPSAPVSGGTVNINSGFTNATYNSAKFLFSISYDATKTVTGTGTAMTLSGTPSFTVVAGDMLIVSGVARKIVTVNTQTSYVIESAFPANPSGTAACVSQAVHTTDLNSYAGNGEAINSALTDNIDRALVDYDDNNTPGNNLPAFNVTPHVAFTISADNSAWSSVSSKPNLVTSLNTSVATPTSSTSLYIRFFANKTSGTGTVNLLRYKALFHYMSQTDITSPTFANLTLTGASITMKALSATPSNPPGGYNKLYFKDGNFYFLDASGVEYSLLPAGMEAPFAGTVAPNGWLMCDGAAVSRTTYARLFAAIGTTHGQGDGSTTFNVPDYRGRFLRGTDGVAGRDPDSASRTAMNTGGNTGNNVGSVQSDELRSHFHVTPGSTFNSNVGTGGVSIMDNDGTQNTQNTGGNETRPVNAYANFIIKT